MKLLKPIFILSTFFSLLFFSAIGQTNNIQWANAVIDVSSDYTKGNKEQFKASQVLGFPNAIFHKTSHPCAWSPDLPFRNDGEFIIVSYQKAQQVRQIIIAESLNTGTVDSIFLKKPDGKFDLVYSSNEDSIIRKISTLNNIILDKTTEYKTNVLKLKLNTVRNAAWNHIDAIGISKSSKKQTISFPVVGSITSSKEKLNTSINSTDDEFLPLITADGSRLLFNKSEKEDFLYMSKIDEDGNFSNAVKLEFENNIFNKKSLYAYSISTNGSTILLGNRFSDTGKESEGVSLTHINSNGKWSIPKPLLINGYKNESEYSEYFLSSNEQVLLMSIQNNSSIGDRDIYVSFLQKNQKWTKPKSLGKVINTAYSDFSPCLSADNKTLFFTSNGHGGYGEADIFMSKRLDDSWTNWSFPMNLGKQFNTNKWDMSVSADLKNHWLYFASDGKSGNMDIFRAKMPVESYSEPIKIILGNIYKQSSQKTLSADIYLKKGNDVLYQQSVSAINGYYTVVIPSKYKNWELIIESDGFFTKTILEKEIFSNSNNIQRKNIMLQPISVGAELALDDILFEKGTDQLLSTEKSQSIKKLKVLLTQYPNLQILLEGHTDFAGKEEENLILSQKRAEKIKQLLIEVQISPKRISCKGFGSKYPISRAYAEEDREVNRRVVAKVIKF